MALASECVLWPRAESAIQEAIKEFNITDREQQKRLAARPVKMKTGRYFRSTARQ
jgi:hypothetical protein